jgi:hypothetical protein
MWVCLIVSIYPLIEVGASPVADSGGLLTPGTDFDLTESHGDDDYDWKLWKE